MVRGVGPHVRRLDAALAQVRRAREGAAVRLLWVVTYLALVAWGAWTTALVVARDDQSPSQGCSAPRPNPAVQSPRSASNVRPVVFATRPAGAAP